MSGSKFCGIRRFTWTLLALALATATVYAGTPATSPGPTLSVTPLYIARAPFAVLGPAPVVGGSHNAAAAAPEDAKQIIARQQFLFTQDGFLNTILQCAEFHPQDKPNQECAWLVENKSDPISALKRDLKVAPYPDAAAFEITMTAGDPTEAVTLLQGAVKVFRQHALKESQSRKDKYLQALESTLKESQADYLLKNEALIDLGKRRNIDALKVRYEIEKNTLQNLDADIRRTEAAATAAESQVKALEARKAEGRDIPLPFETVQAIENDLTLSALNNARNTAVQDQAGLAATANDRKAMADPTDRIAKIDEQIRDRRKYLIDAARDSVLVALKKEAIDQRALADQLPALRQQSQQLAASAGMDLAMKNTLQNLEADIRHAEAAATEAENQVKALEARKAEGREIPLPFETQQSIENDLTLTALNNARHVALQEQAGQAAAAVDRIRLADSTARIAKIEEQIRDRRKLLADAARESLLATLHKEAGEKRATADQLPPLRKKSEDLITMIGSDLQVWQQRADEVKQAADLLTRLQTEFKLAMVNRALDDTRIAPLGEPVTPTKPD